MNLNNSIRSFTAMQQHANVNSLQLPTSLPNSLVSASMVGPAISSPQIDNPNEVFVGNLSFFCEEHHLLDLFQPYSTVTHCRIMRSEDRTRSLLFGFVAFSSRYEMVEMCKLFNGHVMFGRKLRIQPSSNRSVVENIGSELGLQIHLSISSAFPPDQIIRPTEQLLYKYFMQFGSISDVQVNCYTVHAMPSKQEGYAFITFEDHQSVERIVSNPRHVILGITVMCAKSNRKPKRIIQPNGRMAPPMTAGLNNHHALNNQLSHPGLPLPPQQVHLSHSSQQMIGGGRMYDNQNLLHAGHNSQNHLLNHGSLLDSISLHGGVHGVLHEGDANRWRANSIGSNGGIGSNNYSPNGGLSSALSIASAASFGHGQASPSSSIFDGSLNTSSHSSNNSVVNFPSGSEQSFSQAGHSHHFHERPFPRFEESNNSNPPGFFAAF